MNFFQADDMGEWEGRKEGPRAAPSSHNGSGFRDSQKIYPLEKAGGLSEDRCVPWQLEWSSSAVQGGVVVGQWAALPGRMLGCFVSVGSWRGARREEGRKAISRATE